MPRKTSDQEEQQAPTPALSAVDLLDSPNTLTSRQASFVCEYIKDFNAVEAYKRAGYAGRGHVAQSNANALLRVPVVAAEIARFKEQELARMRKRAGVDMEKTLQGIARGAFYDVRKVFGPDGRPLEVTELDDDTAMAIESIEVVEQYQGSGEERVFTGYVKKYRFTKRMEALDKLMKHLGGYEQDNKQQGESQVNAVAALLGQMKRSAVPVVAEVDSDSGI